MGLLTAFNSVASNVASTVTNLNEAGISWSRLIALLLEVLIVFWLTQNFIELVETAISTVWPTAGTLVAVVLYTLMVYRESM